MAGGLSLPSFTGIDGYTKSEKTRLPWLPAEITRNQCIRKTFLLAVHFG